MHTKIITAIALIALLLGCEHKPKSRLAEVVNSSAKAAFDMGAISMASAIMENPSIADLDGKDQLNHARQWYLKKFGTHDWVNTPK